MSKKQPMWRELAEKNLDTEDEIQKSFSGEFDGESGYLIMSNRKLQFVQEEGFIRKAYELVLDLPYEKIGKIFTKSRYELDLTEIGGKTHAFKTFERALAIENSLKELM